MDMSSLARPRGRKSVVAALLAVTALVFASVALADNITGTNAGESLIGTPDDDSIHAAGGNDFVYGDDGDDSTLGGLGNDIIETSNGDDNNNGGPGNDTLYEDFFSGEGAGDADVVGGAAGSDEITVADGDPDDLAAGGLGFDECVIDEGDAVSSCEDVFVADGE
jgi:Ca2+-binding RTX toxin-like protein